MRTDSHALADFISRCASEDHEMFTAALAEVDENGVKWVRTHPNGMCSSPAEARADLEVLLELTWEHEPIGPGLCGPCSEFWDAPVPHPCRDVRSFTWMRWHDRPGYWHGWSPRRFTGDLSRLPVRHADGRMAATIA